MREPLIASSVDKVMLPLAPGEMAIPSGSRTHDGAQTFDVSVLAFPAATSRTLQGLMQLFNIDEPSAQRLVASVPLLLNQQLTAADAENLAQALRVLGARVVVEPTPLPTAQHSRWQQPGGYEEELLPQPRMPAMQNDNDGGLEYDMLASQEPDYAADAAISVSPSMRSPIDMELGVNEPDRLAEDRGLRRQRQESIDLEPPTHGQGLELASASMPARERQRERERETSARVDRTRSAPRAAVAAQPAVRTKTIPTDPAPHGRASLVQQAAHSEAESKTTHLLQVLFAIAVAAVGYWADSSVLFGSASLWSVVAHGVGLYQLVLGVRGLVT